MLAHRPPERACAARASPRCPASTPESTALAKELKRSGFRFVGPTTAYALQQAVGHVNDHLAGCLVRDDVEASARARLRQLAPEPVPDGAASGRRSRSAGRPGTTCPASCGSAGARSRRSRSRSRASGRPSDPEQTCRRPARQAPRRRAATSSPAPTPSSSSRGTGRRSRDGSTGRDERPRVEPRRRTLERDLAARRGRPARRSSRTTYDQPAPIVAAPLTNALDLIRGGAPAARRELLLALEQLERGAQLTLAQLERATDVQATDAVPRRAAPRPRSASGRRGSRRVRRCASCRARSS